MHSLLLCLLVAQAPSQASAPEPTALITGRVVDGVTGKPIAAASVGIQRNQTTAGSRPPVNRVLTDSDGQFFFDSLSKGSYTLTAGKGGWLPGVFGQRRPDGGSRSLELTKDDEMRAGITVMMWKYGVISGTVVDEAGEPAVDIQVRAIRRRYIAGQPRLELAGVARTDDRGEFRISGLTPGEYTSFLPSETSSGPSLFGGGDPPDAWYQTMTGIGSAPLVYSRDAAMTATDGRNQVVSTMPMQTAPGTAEWLSVPPTFPGGAAAPSGFFRLGPGEDRAGLSLAIHRVPTQSISGTLIVPGSAAANHVLHLLPADLADFPLFEVATAAADATGAFTFFGVPNGSYVIRVVKSPMPAGTQRFALLNSVRDMSFVGIVSNGPSAAPAVSDEPLYFANELVSVNSKPVKDIVITLRGGVRVTGRAEFNGSAARPAPEAWPRTTVLIEPANGFTPMNGRIVPYGVFAADGTFKTPSLLPGSYVLRPGAPPGWFVKSVNAGGRDVTERAIDLSADLTDVVVTYTDHAASISGGVAAASGGGTALDDVTVLLFPADRQSWTNYGASSRTIASARVKADGSFSLAAPPPGAYMIVAIPDDQAVDWQSPAALAKLAAAARSLDVRDGESPVVDLTVRTIR